MAKAKQTAKEATQEEQFLFAIGSPEGDMVLKVSPEGNIMYLKDQTTLEEAAKAFWNSFEGFLPITLDEIAAHGNDADLGSYVRSKMQAKLNQQ